MDVERHDVHTIRPNCDAVIAAVEAHACFDKINSSELI